MRRRHAARGLLAGARQQREPRDAALELALEGSARATSVATIPQVVGLGRVGDEVVALGRIVWNPVPDEVARRSHERALPATLGRDLLEHRARALVVGPSARELGDE